VKIHQIGRILVLEFDDTEEAQYHGWNLVHMAPGCKFYATAPENTPQEELARALEEAERRLGETPAVRHSSRTRKMKEELLSVILWFMVGFAAGAAVMGSRLAQGACLAIGLSFFVVVIFIAVHILLDEIKDRKLKRQWEEKERDKK